MLSNTIFEDVYSNMIFEQNNKKAIQDAARQCDKLMSSLNSKQGVAKLKKFLQTNPIMQKLIKEFEINKSIMDITNLAFESVIVQQDQKKEQKKQEKKDESAELRQMIQKQNELIDKLSKKVNKKSILPDKVKKILISTAVFGLGAVATYYAYPHIFPETCKAAKENYKEKSVSQVQDDNNEAIKKYNKETKSVRQALDNTQATVVRTGKTMSDAARRPVTTTAVNVANATDKITGKEKTSEEKKERDQKIQKNVEQTGDALKKGTFHPVETTKQNFKNAWAKISGKK